MASVKMYNQEGIQTGELELDAQLFEVEVNEALVHEAVIAQQANSRDSIAHTKTRGEVRGGGRKPWRQKGTGRARHGSRRSPIWIGGGITFGPRSIRNFAKKINRKARRKALAMVLSDKLANEKIIVVESLSLGEAKTKELHAVLGRLPSAGKKILVVTVPEDKTIALAAKNLPKVSTMPAHSINVIELLRNDFIVVTKDAINVISQTHNRA